MPTEILTSNPPLEEVRQELQSQPVKPREPFPIEVIKSELISDLISHDTVVLKAGTGSGKSTIGPLVFLEALKRANPGKLVKMIVAEPRQMLAEGISSYVAKTNGVPLGGNLIGFYHGDGQKYSPETQIVYTVNGSLRKRIQEDKALKDYDAVFLDEIHLRDTDQETILIGLKEVQKTRVKQGLKPLKIVIASANADQKYADYYGNAAMREIEGQESRYNVEKHFADQPIDRDNISLEMGRLAAKLIKDPKHYGDIVGFLPGRREIQIAQAEFNRIIREEGLSEKYKSASLTGGGGEENKALQKKLGDDDPNRDPIAAFATDVAEAGATFARLTKVIDSGLLRTMVYDKETGLESLETRNHAVSHYIQRLGRLGRTGNGEFYAMYSEEELNNQGIHPKDALPSILKEDLTPLVLSLKAMGITDVYKVDYIDHPGKEKLDLAVETLSLLGALKPDGTLSDEGKGMVELPLDPHFTRMLVEAKKRGCVEAVSVLAAFLNSNKSVFAYNPKGEYFNKKYAAYIHPDSDYLTLLNVWNTYITTPRDERTMWAMQHGFSPSVLHDVAIAHDDLLQEDFLRSSRGDKRDQPVDITAQEEAIKACVVAGFMDRILLRSGDTYTLENGKKQGIQIDRSSVLAREHPAMFISGLIRVQEGGRVYAGMNQKVTREFINEVAPYLEAIRNEKELLKKEENAAVKATKELHKEAMKSGLAAHNEPIQTPAVIEKKLSFIGRLKQAFKNIFARIKALLGL